MNAQERIQQEIDRYRQKIEGLELALSLLNGEAAPPGKAPAPRPKGTGAKKGTFTARVLTALKGSPGMTMQAVADAAEITMCQLKGVIGNNARLFEKDWSGPEIMVRLKPENQHS